MPFKASYLIPGYGAYQLASDAVSASERRGRKRKAQQNDLLESNTGLLELLRERYKGLEGQSPTETAQYRSGLSALQEVLQGQARNDASAAAARGLSGSEFEIAQAGNRGRALAQGTRGLLADSERFQEGRETSALQQLLGGQNLFNATRLNLFERDDRRREQNLGALTGLFRSGASIFAGA